MFAHVCAGRSRFWNPRWSATRGDRGGVSSALADSLLAPSRAYCGRRGGRVSEPLASAPASSYALGPTRTRTWDLAGGRPAHFPGRPSPADSGFAQATCGWGRHFWWSTCGPLRACPRPRCKSTVERVKALRPGVSKGGTAAFAARSRAHVSEHRWQVPARGTGGGEIVPPGPPVHSQDGLCGSRPSQRPSFSQGR